MGILYNGTVLGDEDKTDIKTIAPMTKIIMPVITTFCTVLPFDQTVLICEKSFLSHSFIMPSRERINNILFNYSIRTQNLKAFFRFFAINQGVFAI
jgi:hypothetical protein